MEVKLSDHARFQNKLRKIPLSRIKLTLTNPDNIIKSFRGRKLYQKAFSGKILEVVAKEKEGKFIVITQYYLKDEN